MNRYLIYGLLAGMAGTLVLGGCRAAGEPSDGQETAAGAGKETVITAADNSISIEGDGASADGNIITISSAGTYRLSGAVENGRVAVEAGEEEEVRLILDGFSVTSTDFSAIYGSQCGALTVVAEEGTKNVVSDGTEYHYANSGEDEPDAAIFCKDDLILEGSGMLTVHGNYQNGIRGKDDLTIKSGTYVIEAVNDGIKGKDSVEVEDGIITITAGGDGIQSSNDTDQEKGYVRISGGTLSIAAAKKGIQAETLVEIGGGTLQVEAEDDAVHSNGDIKIASGTSTLSSGDDAVHANQRVEVSGGEITVLKSYEGLEGLSVEILGGTIQITSRDDGINASETRGTGSFADEKRSGAPFEVTEGAYIRIAGGTVRINASGDGIDSNGDLSVEGGVIWIDGPLEGRNGILDYDGTGTISGGTLFGTGSAGMFQNFSEESSQPVLVVFYAERRSDGSEVAVTDGEGSQLTTFTSSKEFSALMFSSPELNIGETYKIIAGEEAVELTVNGILNQSGTNAGAGVPEGKIERSEDQTRRPQRQSDGPERTEGEISAPADRGMGGDRTGHRGGQPPQSEDWKRDFQTE